jgi:hypothetical protein
LDQAVSYLSEYGDWDRKITIEFLKDKDPLKLRNALKKSGSADYLLPELLAAFDIEVFYGIIKDLVSIYDIITILGKKELKNFLGVLSDGDFEDALCDIENPFTRADVENFDANMRKKILNFLKLQDTPSLEYFDGTITLKDIESWGASKALIKSILSNQEEPREEFNEEAELFDTNSWIIHGMIAKGGKLTKADLKVVSELTYPRLEKPYTKLVEWLTKGEDIVKAAQKEFTALNGIFWHRENLLNILFASNPNGPLPNLDADDNVILKFAKLRAAEEK